MLKYFNSKATVNWLWRHLTDNKVFKKNYVKKLPSWFFVIFLKINILAFDRAQNQANMSSLTDYSIAY